jgi:hypothetical protein
MFEYFQRLYSFGKFLISYREWDYAHLIELNIFAINRIANTIEKNNIIVSNKRVARQMRYAAFLLKRINSGNYFDKEYQALADKYEPGPLFTPDGYYRVPPEYSQELRKLFEKEEELLQKDIDRLGRHVRKNYRKWWD